MKIPCGRKHIAEEKVHRPITIRSWPLLTYLLQKTRKGNGSLGMVNCVGKSVSTPILLSALFCKSAPWMWDKSLIKNLRIWRSLLKRPETWGTMAVTKLFTNASKFSGAVFLQVYGQNRKPVPYVVLTSHNIPHLVVNSEARRQGFLAQPQISCVARSKSQGGWDLSFNFVEIHGLKFKIEGQNSVLLLGYFSKLFPHSKSKADFASEQ